jgi:hypothetical protein
VSTEQHINSLIEEAQQDFGASEALAAAGTMHTPYFLGTWYLKNYAKHYG